jgi:hypothetical protein
VGVLVGVRFTTPHEDYLNGGTWSLVGIIVLATQDLADLSQTGDLGRP